MFIHNVLAISGLQFWSIYIVIIIPPLLLTYQNWFIITITLFFLITLDLCKTTSGMIYITSTLTLNLGKYLDKRHKDPFVQHSRPWYPEQKLTWI